MAKKERMAERKVWTPKEYLVQIGNSDYTIAPVPIERLIEFERVVKHLGDGLSDLSDSYYITNGTGDNVQGPFEDLTAAEKYITNLYPDYDHDQLEAFFEENPGKRLQIETKEVSMRDILDALVSAPYPALQVLIPELTEEDCRQASLPNLQFVYNTIIEVNGIAWFERFVKNSLAPLLPDIMESLVGVVKGALSDTTEMENKTDGGIV